MLEMEFLAYSCSLFMSICHKVLGPVGNCSSSFDEVRKKYLLSNGINTED